MNNNVDYRDILLKDNLSRIKNKVIVLSGKGGVGKSTVAVNLAYGFAIRGFKTGLLDVDLHGPSIAKMTNIENITTLEKSKDGRFYPIRVVENLYVLSIATFLKNSDDPVIWRGPLKMGAIKQFLTDIYWPEIDVLVIDCPPGTGDEPLSVVQLIGSLDGAIIVTTPQDVSMLDVSKSIRFCQTLDLKILGVIENMSYFVCPHCNNKVNIFEGKASKNLSEKYNIDVIGKVPIDPDISKSSDSGRPYIYDFAKKEGGIVFGNIVEKIIDKIKK
jgi:Mrp family chromosome partitioning ATPase